MRMSEDMFGKDPAAPQFLVGFLRHILVERLKLTDESVHPALSLSTDRRIP